MTAETGLQNQIVETDLWHRLDPIYPDALAGPYRWSVDVYAGSMTPVMTCTAELIGWTGTIPAARLKKNAVRYLLQLIPGDEDLLGLGKFGFTGPLENTDPITPGGMSLLVTLSSRNHPDITGTPQYIPALQHEMPFAGGSKHWLTGDSGIFGEASSGLSKYLHIGVRHYTKIVQEPSWQAFLRSAEIMLPVPTEQYPHPERYGYVGFEGGFSRGPYRPYDPMRVSTTAGNKKTIYPGLYVLIHAIDADPETEASSYEKHRIAE